MYARSNKLALIAITAALASPFALAQSAPAQELSASATATETAASPVQPVAATQAEVAATTTTTTTTSSQPAPAATPQRKPWSAIDTDGDGKISAVEAQTDAAFLKHFPSMDADKDGFVTVAEYKAHVAGKAAKKSGSQG